MRKLPENQPLYRVAEPNPEDRALPDAYLGEIRLFPYNRIPPGWHLCDGTEFAPGYNSSLFALLGVAYGGDGTNTYALPDLRGRTPVGTDGKAGNYPLGQAGGAETVALTAAEMPAHIHSFQVTDNPGNTGVTAGAIYAQVTQPQPANIYGTMSNPPVAIDPSSVVPTGSGLPHDNMQPYLALVYCICTVGDFPPRGP